MDEDENCCEWYGEFYTINDYDGIYEKFYCKICGKETCKKIGDYDD